MAQNLVNDLDLIVTAPGGTQYCGNVFSGGWSQTAGSPDHANNVENVYIQSAAQGTWTVQVSGYNVPYGPQPFALVVDGAFGVIDSPPGVTITNPTQGATITGPVDITADAGDDIGVTQVEFFVDGSTIGTDTDGTDGWSHSWNSTTVANGIHTISTTVTDTSGQTRSDSINVTVDNVNEPPVAGFYYVCVYPLCTLNASESYDPDGTLTHYDWVFGDGTSGSGVTPLHSYSAPGNYEVQLTVTDNGGMTDTDMQMIGLDEQFAFHVGDLDGSSVDTTAVVGKPESPSASMIATNSRM